MPGTSASSSPGQVEPVRDRLRRLADRGWLHRAPASRFTVLPRSLAGSAPAGFRRNAGALDGSGVSVRRTSPCIARARTRKSWGRVGSGRNSESMEQALQGACHTDHSGYTGSLGARSRVSASPHVLRRPAVPCPSGGAAAPPFMALTCGFPRLAVRSGMCWPHQGLIGTCHKSDSRGARHRGTLSVHAGVCSRGVSPPVELLRGHTAERNRSGSGRGKERRHGSDAWLVALTAVEHGEPVCVPGPALGVVLNP
jgi:hypothetical protein